MPIPGGEITSTETWGLTPAAEEVVEAVEEVLPEAEDEALAELYPKMGEALKRKFAGWNTYFLTNDLRMPKLMRLTPSKRTPLFNGPLECRLFEIKMVAGSNRKA